MDTSLPQGFLAMGVCCNLKKDALDLAVIYSTKVANSYAVFTKNTICGAPIIVGREIIKNQLLQALVINSKISNVATGKEGIKDARTMGEVTAKELGISPDLVLMSSTGIIAKKLEIEKIVTGLENLQEKLSNDCLQAARAIMTTDTYPKVLSAKVGDAKITIIAKGSGMVEPNMATMLVYILTDANLSKQFVKDELTSVVNKTFNMLSIDADMSTSDSCVLMANGLIDKVDYQLFSKTLEDLCIQCTEMLARDGEGATKLIRANILNAKNDHEAKIFAKSIINSPLVKTMAFGGDPNIGRLLMALGKNVSLQLDINKLEIILNGISIFKDGIKLVYNDDDLRNEINKDTVDFTINLNLQTGNAIAYGCDLSHGYIDENAAYYSS